MSDIRLKKITIENGPLIIQNGQITITDTSSSINIISSALTVNGGISVNCTSNAVSSTSGGAITIGGGLAVSKNTFIGSNLTLENNSSTFTINGITNNRLFFDTVNNKKFTISPDGITTRFSLSDTDLVVNYTQPSTNSTTGSFVINGGVSINCSVNSTNNSVGGALTINGGTSIIGDVFLAKSLVLGETFSGNTGLTLRYVGSSGKQILLNNSSGNAGASLNMNGGNLFVLNNSVGDINFKVSSGNFVFSNYTTGNTLLTITGNNSIFNKSINVNDTTESLNNSTASFLTSGGISINCTTDANNSFGGALTVRGGINVNKKSFLNDVLCIQPTLDNNNKLVLYQSSADATQQHFFTGLGSNNGSLSMNLQSNVNDFIFNISNTAGNNNIEVFRIKGTNEVQFIGNTQKYSILGGGSSSNDLTIKSNSVSTPMSLNLISSDSDRNDNVDIKIVGYSNTNYTNNEYLKIGWDSTINSYSINTVKTGNGVNTSIVLQSNSNTEQLKLLANGTISMSSTQLSQNSTTASLLLFGGISINNTNDAFNISNGSALTIAGGMSVAKSVYSGNLNIYSSNTGGNVNFSSNTRGDLLVKNASDNFVFAGNNTSQNYSSSIELYSLNNQKSNNYELISVSLNNSVYNLNSNNGGSGVLRSIQINTGNNNGIFLNTFGNIGINTTNPTSTLDVFGTLNCSNFSNFDTLKINNTSDATNFASSGSLSVLGGTSISKKLFVGGVVTLFDTTNSNGSSASLLVSGGLTITNLQNSTFGSGSMTILGGISVAKDLFIGQSLNVSNLISANGSNLGYLILNNTTNSINLSTGNLISSGGITINCTTNAINISNGGSILTSGGISIGKDMYIGGNLYNYGNSNYYGNINSLINMYDSLNILRFSIDRNTSSNDFSISRYDSSSSFIEKSINISNVNGIVTLNNTKSSTSSNSASLILMGGLTINSTSNSTNLVNGGGITLFGGASIAKNVYIGGDVILSSTTVSTNSSNGSLIVNGGLGVSGNLNVLGNTLISGNLTIMGTTTSIQSTTTLLNDNVFLLNSGPVGSKDSGVLIQRFQTDNDTGLGDVVYDNPFVINNLPSQSGMSSTQFKLNVSENSIDEYYTGWYIKITSGFSNNQVRKITSYIGLTRIATISSSWTTQNPTGGDSFSLYNKSFVGLIYDETNDRFNFGSTALDPTNSVVFTDTLPIHFSSATSTATQNSTNASTGGLLIAGSIAISNTNDSVSSTNGSAMTIAGGMSVAKTLHVGNSLYIGNINVTPNIGDLPTTLFTGANNVITQSDITGLSFTSDVWGFDVYLVARVTATSNLYSNYHIRGVNKGSTWEIVKTYVGDSIAEFYITNTGQIKYTSNNFSGFSSLIFKFKAHTN